jgi:transcription elongation factor GreA
LRRYFEAVTETHLSPQAHQRLVDELEDLTTRGRVEIARQIEAARALGDLSENGDYHAAKDAQGKMESRIRQLQAMLASAVIVDPAASSGEVVAGSVVGLRYSGDDDVETYLVGSIEERPEDVAVISVGSPLGQALLGHAAGDTVSYEAPNGALEVEIVSVS